jgi:aminoacyl-tRNA hydrolase
LARPRIGVITNVGTDHFSFFGSQDAIAVEKSKLVAALPSDGTAVLNADDPRVLAMRSKCAGRVVTYGLSPDAIMRAEDVRCAWPDRLSFKATCGGESIRIQSQLCGSHWTPCILAAMAVGQIMGVSLSEAAEAIATMPPFPGRMSPVITPDGVTFVRDDQKAPMWTIPASLAFMRQATARRKIVIIGTISDFPGNPAKKYPRVARNALEVADHVLFVGNSASKSLTAKAHPKGVNLHAFVTVDHLFDFMRRFLRPDDLVLLKGSRSADDLEQLVTKWMSAIPHDRLKARKALQNDDPRFVFHQCSRTLESAKSDVQVIVGLGNPGSKYRNTPHNIGYRVLDMLAESLQEDWVSDEYGMAARAQLAGQSLLLLKPYSFMNEIGPLLLSMANSFGAGPQHFVLVHDDIHLDPGVVRNRMSGSSGGHKGVQSIIAAFRTEAIRRVKIGVGRPNPGAPVTQHVLRPFGVADLALMDDACRRAANRIRELVRANKAPVAPPGQI